MALAARRRVETPQARAERDRVERARRADPRWDAQGEFFDLCSELGQRLGVDVADVYEEFNERSAVRHYLGETTIAEAERLAWLDVQDRFDRQGRL